MNSLPVRLFHASLSGILVAIFITLLVFHVQQRFHTPPPRQDIVKVVEREVKRPTPVTPSATYDPNDRDDDKILDTWETTYSHNPYDKKDAGKDFDFDGLTAEQEYKLFVQTGGQYGNPLGKYELSSTTLPDDFESHPTTGAPLITSVTLIEAAKNGLTLAKVGGVLAGETTHTYTNYTYDPFSEEWTRILPPSDVPLSTSMVATDVNSQGHVVGYYYSGGTKGFIWNPAAPESQSGESKQFFLNPLAVSPNSPTPAIPKRISDTGYLLYSIGSPNNTLKAADNRQLAIEPIAGSWTQPTYIDVNDYGEYVGVIPNPVTWQSNTFLAIPYGPVYLSELQASDFKSSIVGVYSPDVDYSAIQWDEPEYVYPDDFYDAYGNYIDPYGEFTYGSATDRTNNQQFQFRRSNYEGTIWWYEPNNYLWRSLTCSSFPAVVNDWGEFAGRFDEALQENLTYEYDGGMGYDDNGNPIMSTYSEYWTTYGQGVFLFDGSYHLNVTGYNVFGISNDPQVLVGLSKATHLWSDSVVAPLTKILPPSTSYTTTKICDNGIMIIQSGSFIKVLAPSDDADGDGMPDDWEQWAMGKARELNPSLQISDIDRLGDLDGDGTNNLVEFFLRSDPNAAPIEDSNGVLIDTRDGIDTDGDLVPNSWECLNGMNYNYAPDAKEDFDRDGYTNLQEYRFQTDPRGAPAYRIREIGPFPGAAAVDLDSAVLGTGLVSESTVTESVYISTTPSGPADGGRRPAEWSVQHSAQMGEFAIYNSNLQIGNAYTYPVVQSASGAAVRYGGNSTRTYWYWNNSLTPPVELPGDVSSISNVNISPSGKYLTASRIKSSNTNEQDLILWRLPTEGRSPQITTMPLTYSFGNKVVTLTYNSKLYVNDSGYIATDGMEGNSKRALLLHIDDDGTIEAVRLPAFVESGWSSVVGLSNASDPVVAGTAVTESSKTHAVFWAKTGQINDVGTLGGANSSMNLISTRGHMAGVSEILVNNAIKFQPFIVTPFEDTETHLTTWIKQAQGEPSSSATIVLKSIAGSGEVLGSLRVDPSRLAVDTLWAHGRAYPLDSTIPGFSGYSLSSVLAVNANGTLLATTLKGGECVTVLLTPDQDTDGDGLPDAFENQHGFNAYVKNSPDIDSDSDLLSDLDEYRNGTDPHDPDTDGDRMKDGWEVGWGLLPLDPFDAALDPDNDRVTNFREFEIGTIPTGIYRIETRFVDTNNVEPSVLTSDDSGRILFTERCQYEGDGNYYSYFQNYSVIGGLSSGSGGSTSLVPFRNTCDYSIGPPEYSSSNDSPTYRLDPVSGSINGYLQRYVSSYDGATTYGTETGFLIPDADTKLEESQWIPWQTVESNLMVEVGTILDPSDTLNPYPDAVSPSGTRRIHRTAMGGCLVINESGEYVETLDPYFWWQAITDEGSAVALSSNYVPPSNGYPAYYAPELIISSGEGTSYTVPIPPDREASCSYSLQGVSEDGKALISKSSLNDQLTSITQSYLFDIDTGDLSLVRKPGFGAEYISALSSSNGRLLGTGPKPFQITPDGTCIRLEALRIKSSTNAALLRLSDPSVFPRTLTPNHIASDGRITLTTTNASGQTVILQLVPFNDADGDGMMDDWEKSWSAEFLEALHLSPDAILNGSLPLPYPNNLSLGALQLLAVGNLDPEADYTGEGISASSIASKSTDLNNSLNEIYRKELSYRSLNYRHVFKDWTPESQIDDWGTTDLEMIGSDTSMTYSTSPITPEELEILATGIDWSEPIDWCSENRFGESLGSPIEMWSWFDQDEVVYSDANETDTASTAKFEQQRFRIKAEEISKEPRVFNYLEFKQITNLTGGTLNADGSRNWDKVIPRNLVIQAGKFYSNWIEVGDVHFEDGEWSRTKLIKVNIELVAINENGIPLVDDDSQTGPPLFMPTTTAPSLSASASVTNVTVDHTGKIVGHLAVSGTITSKTCDMVYGENGVITTAEIVVNNDRKNPAIANLVTQECAPGPSGGVFRYPKSFTLNKDLGIVELVVGENLVEVKAIDPITKMAGSVLIGFNVSESALQNAASDCCEDHENESDLSVDAPNTIYTSTKGDFFPYYVGFVGGPEIQDALKGGVGKFRISLDGVNDHEAMWDGATNRVVLVDPNTPNPAPLVFIGAPRVGNMPTESEEAERSRNCEDMLSRLVESDPARFYRGYVDGIWDGGVSLVEGTGNAISGYLRWSVNGLATFGFTMRLGLASITGNEEGQRMSLEGIEYLLDVEQDTNAMLMQTSKALWEFQQKSIQVQKDLLILYFGDLGNSQAAAGRLSDTHDEVAFMCGELFKYIANNLGGSDAYKLGKIYGRISFEAASMIIGVGELQALAKATKVERLAALMSRAKNIGWVREIKGWTKVEAEVADFIADCGSLSAGCFIAGTLVSTSTGKKPIESISVGDMVLSRDPYPSGRTGWKPVVTTLTNNSSNLVRITYSRSGSESTGSLVGTDSHPFWVEEVQDFVPMGQLKSGYSILTSSGDTAKIIDLAPVRGPPLAPIKTYNLEVADFHTYFVGSEGIWVHNTCSGCDAIETAYMKFVRTAKLNVRKLGDKRFELLIQARDSLLGAKIVKSADWCGFAVSSTKKMFGEVLSGSLPTSKFPTVADWNDRYFFRMINGELKQVIWKQAKRSTGLRNHCEIHHIVMRELFNRLKASGRFPKLANLIDTSVPGGAYTQADHKVISSLMAVVRNSEFKARDVAVQAQAYVDLLKANNYKAEAMLAEDWLKSMDVLQ